MNESINYRNRFMNSCIDGSTSQIVNEPMRHEECIKWQLSDKSDNQYTLMRGFLLVPSPAMTLGCSRVAPNWGQVCSSSGSIKQQKLLTADSRVYLQPDRDRLPSCHCGVTTVEEINQKWTIDST